MEEQTIPTEPAAPANPEQVDLTQEFLPFFKALADATRLKIIGLLATHPQTVEDLAEALNLRPSTISHHLAMMSEVGLVTARAESYYNIYRLETNKFEKTIVQVLAQTRQKETAPEYEGPAYDRKVLRTYLTPEGQIKALPAQDKKVQVVIRHVAQAFEPGVRYSEKQVNEILKRFSEDEYVTLRRYLIVYKLMDRQGGGGEYWRIA